MKCCELIDNLHRLRILHCDIKPGNFMIDMDPHDPFNIHVSVIDYGLSKKLNNDAEDFCKRTIECGTKEYMAPEISDELLYSTYSDVFALGYLMNHDLKVNDPENKNALVNKMNDAYYSYDDNFGMFNTYSTLRPTLKDVIAELRDKVMQYALKIINIDLKNYSAPETVPLALNNLTNTEKTNVQKPTAKVKSLYQQFEMAKSAQKSLKKNDPSNIEQLIIELNAVIKEERSVSDKSLKETIVLLENLLPEPQKKITSKY